MLIGKNNVEVKFLSIYVFAQYFSILSCNILHKNDICKIIKSLVLFVISSYIIIKLRKP